MSHLAFFWAPVSPDCRTTETGVSIALAPSRTGCWVVVRGRGLSSHHSSSACLRATRPPREQVPTPGIEPGHPDRRVCQEFQSRRLPVLSRLSTTSPGEIGARAVTAAVPALASPAVGPDVRPPHLRLGVVGVIELPTRRLAACSQPRFPAPARPGCRTTWQHGPPTPRERRGVSADLVSDD